MCLQRLKKYAILNDMIAEFVTSLPFPIILPDKPKFRLYKYKEGGYTISIYPPIRIDASQINDKMENVLINDMPAYPTNGLQVFFRKKFFDRKSSSDCDPPVELILKTINGFLAKLRFVAQSTQIKLVNLKEISWNLRYLNDDGSELEKEKGLIRGRGAETFRFSWTAINNKLWDDIFSLPHDYKPPQWNTLLLDANTAIPEIGPSVVLGATALEVFIADILNKLAKDSTIPVELWEWIKKRDHWLKDPSVNEQFDILLKTLLGFSLKDNQVLWEAYRNLKDARNSFVHEGIALIGKRKKILSANDTRNLLQKVRKIIELIQSKLPKALKNPVYKHNIKVSFSARIKIAK